MKIVMLGISKRYENKQKLKMHQKRDAGYIKLVLKMHEKRDAVYIETVQT